MWYADARMAEQLLSRRPEKVRATTKVEPVPLRGMQSWTSRPVMLVAVAVAGAVLGHLLSQIAAHWLADRPTTPSALRPLAAHGERGAPLSVASSAADRMMEIERALDSRDFTLALLLTEEALLAFPGDTQFLAKRQRAEDELHNRFRYQTFQGAVSRQNYAAAMALFNEIPADSVMKFKATQDLRPVRDQYITEQLAAAQAAAKLGQCTEARTYAQAVLNLDSGNQDALTLSNQCGNNKPPPPEAYE